MLVSLLSQEGGKLSGTKGIFSKDTEPTGKAPTLLRGDNMSTKTQPRGWNTNYIKHVVLKEKTKSTRALLSEHTKQRKVVAIERELYTRRHGHCDPSPRNRTSYFWILQSEGNGSWETSLWFVSFVLSWRIASFLDDLHRVLLSDLIGVVRCLIKHTTGINNIVTECWTS